MTKILNWIDVDGWNLNESSKIEVKHRNTNPPNHLMSKLNKLERDHQTLRDAIQVLERQREKSEGVGQRKEKDTLSDMRKDEGKKIGEQLGPE